jgi:UDP-3-O-[3-hydroxymyristoyl] glucosamine N-acyltransferase
MQLAVSELASMVNGTVEGDSTIFINNIAKIEAGEPGSLSFLANMKYEQFLYTTKCSAVLVQTQFVPAEAVSTTLIRVDDPYAAFTSILEMMSAAGNNLIGISDKASIHPTAHLGEQVFIGENVVVMAGAKVHDGAKIYPNTTIGEQSEIGNNTVIFSGVSIYNQIKIGNNCIIHSGAVVGSDGFGFAPLPDRSYKKIPQTGNVIIEDDVEIGANCTIDRATLGSTIIKRGVKLDNLVQIAHNVEVGEHTVIAAQSGIAGSTKIGKYCIIAGQVGIVGHSTIADGTVVGAQSGINGSIKEPNQRWFGSPAFEYGKALKSYASLKSLPELVKRVQELENKLNELQKG